MKDEHIGYVILSGTCMGCRNFTWLCRRNRKCTKYQKRPRTSNDYALKVIADYQTKKAIKENGK